MGGKKKYIEMFGSFTEPFKCLIHMQLCWWWKMTINAYFLQARRNRWCEANTFYMSGPTVSIKWLDAAKL